MTTSELAQKHELAEQFLHADLRGVLTPGFALDLAAIAVSYCRGHQPPPPADFDRDDPDPYSAVPDR